MAKPVLFVTGLGKDIRRAENLYALYEAYKGEKKIISTLDPTYNFERESGKYDVQVIDIFPTKPFTGKTIMIWHAIQGGKHIGLDEDRTYYKHEYAKYIDFIVAAGHGAVMMFNLCTHVPMDHILPLGMPRTDRYVGKKKGDGHTSIAKKRAYLYAPTFRTRYEPQLPEIDLESLDNALNDDEVFVIKHHPYTVGQKTGNYKHIIQIDSMHPSADYLYDADVVITDYSSIIFDAYLLGKPAVLFEKTRGYTVSRGMYLDYPDKYCSRYCTNEQDLIQLVRSACDSGLTDTEIACRDFVADACDGKSCERICDFIDRLNGREITLGIDPIHTQPGEKIVTYFSTRNLYNVLPAAYNSLLAYNPDVHVYCFIEDDNLPFKTPQQVTCINVSNQQIFQPYGPCYNTKYTYMILLKTALTKIFPDAHRALILDVDTIVYDSISDLFNLDLSHAYYAAVVEPAKTKSLGIPYANWGVVMMNLDRLRTTGKDNLIINELNTNQHTYPEQDAVNLICGNRFDPIPTDYNVTVPGLTGVPQRTIIRHFACIHDWSDIPIVKYWIKHTQPPKEGDIE